MFNYDEYIHDKYNITYYTMLKYIAYWMLKRLFLFYVLNPYTIKYLVNYII